MNKLGAVLLGSHVLILRVRHEGGRSALREVWRGTKEACESEKWYCNIEGMRGPGVVAAELHVITVDEWKRICAKQVCQ